METQDGLAQEFLIEYMSRTLQGIEKDIYAKKITINRRNDKHGYAVANYNQPDETLVSDDDYEDEILYGRSAALDDTAPMREDAIMMKTSPVILPRSTTRIRSERMLIP